MASYVAMRPPGNESAEHVQFVRDGFSIVAFFVPFIWLAWHRLWLEAILVFAVAVLIGVLGETTAWGPALAPLMTFLGLYVAVDGGVLRVSALKRRGWTEAGVVEANDLDEAEIRWFAGDRPPQQPTPEQAPLPALSPHPAAAKPFAPALGLLSYPGQR